MRIPDAEYASGSCAIDFSDVEDLTTLRSISGCEGATARFSTAMVKRSVPASWNTWGSAPRVESSRPHVLSTNGPSMLTVNYNRPVLMGGVELKQVEYQKTTTTVDFYSGPDGTGTLLGTIVRHTKARYGAKLFAAVTTDGFRSIVITNNDGMYFAIGQVRV